MSKDLEFLRSNGIDIYKLLEIPQNANASTIRKAYRKQALIYHPDKNPSQEAAQTFHSLTLALNILSESQLRAQYDGWINAKALEKLRTEKLDDERRRMKVELERAESESLLKNQESRWNKRKATESSNKLGLDIEKLREEGASKRRAFEAEYLSKMDNKTSKSTTNTKNNEDLNKAVKVKWKIKEGISQFFTTDVLGGILSVFGDVEDVNILERSSNEKRYDTAIVVFKSASSAVRAASHDFTSKSDTWDNTSYRKLSGLLREIKWLNNQSSNILDKSNLGFGEYKDLTLAKLRKFKPMSV